MVLNSRSPSSLGRGRTTTPNTSHSSKPHSAKRSPMSEPAAPAWKTRDTFEILLRRLGSSRLQSLQLSRRRFRGLSRQKTKPVGPHSNGEAQLQGEEEMRLPVTLRTQP